MTVAFRVEPLRVIIPCLDEEAAIGPQVTALRGRLDPSRDRVIVVDNDSRDRTAEVARAAGAEVVSEPERGYGRACLAGLRAAGDGIAVFMDGDGADDLGALEAIVGPVREDSADLVVGVRTAPERGSMTALQTFGNRLSCALISAIYGVRVNDLGPLRSIRVDRLRGLAPASLTYGWSTEMTVKSLRAGLRYREVPVGYRRRSGRSKVSGTVLGSLRAGVRILVTVVRWSRWRPAT